MSPGDTVIFCLGIAVMLVVSLAFGQAARRLRFPAVLGELIGGIVLGPTILGWLSPGAGAWLFPASGPVYLGRDALVQLCMLFFLLAVGLEMDLGLARKRWSDIGWTSLLGIAVPFALGFGAVLLLPQIWGAQAQGRLTLFALFMGVALSISALPVIARILMDLGLMKTDTGTIVMGAAAINDLVGWSLFALVLSYFAPGHVLGLPPYATLALVLLFFVVALTAGRAGGQKVQEWLGRYLPGPGGFLGVAIALMLLGSALAETIGVHAIFGAFLAGIALSRGKEKRDEGHELIYQFAMYFFAPLYFVSIGLRANFVEAFDPVLVTIVLIIACAGKIAGAALGARIGGLPGRQSAAVGFAMNARGAMEMILATVAREAGLIDDRIFVALIVMALVTSAISGPMIRRFHLAAPIKEAVGIRRPYRSMADFEDAWQAYPREED